MKHITLSSVLVLAAFSLSGCDESQESLPFSCSTPIAPVILDNARLTIDEAGRLRDALGRDVIMRGLNAGGRSKFEPFMPFPVSDNAEELRAVADVYFGRLAFWGLDTVRMPFSWEALEPTQGEFDEDYLDRYEMMVDVAWSHGLRVIIDFHQDVYASPFCGDGFPIWTIEDMNPGPPRRDCQAWFTGYLFNADVSEAFNRLWTDETGVQTAMRSMWAEMATRFADHPAVVGFELINEPHLGSAPDADQWKTEVLEPFYENLATELRTIAPEMLIFYDSNPTDSADPQGSTHPVPRGTGFVFAPHYYDSTLMMGLGWSGVSPRPHIESFSHVRDEDGVAILLGEFGYPFGSEGGPDWLRATLDLIDEFRISSTLWEYSESDELWNEENFSVIDGSGQERPILDTYVRPWLRAVAGDTPSFAWDHDSQQGTASWIAADGVTEIVLPRRLFPQGPSELSLEGQDACLTWDSSRGELRVRGQAGTEVTLTFQ